MVCGRFTSLTSPEELAVLFSAELVMTEASSPPRLGDGPFTPNFNVAPSTAIQVVARGSDGLRKLGRMTWGLVPSWAKERRGSGHINARAETISEKPSFRPSVAHKRCLIPMDGYFEWRTVVDADASTLVPAKAPKRAVYVTRSDGRPMAVAGLWSTWRPGPDEPSIRTCCVITTAANSKLARIHDRMPVVLEDEDWTVWLGEGTEESDGAVGEALPLLVPAGDSVLTMIDVGPLVNSVRNNSAELIQAVGH